MLKILRKIYILKPDETNF